MWTYKKLSLHPVLILPEQYPVFDLSRPPDVQEVEKHKFGIGRYNEKRENMYLSEQYQKTESGKAEVRNIHMGIDIFAPIETPIFAFTHGKIFLFGYNSLPLDYGYTLITEHNLGSQTIYALHGHLSRKSIEGKSPGQEISPGETIGWLGNPQENGGWPPHLHFQISLEKPTVPDMPGVVSSESHAEALAKYLDPRIVLGPIY